MEISRIQSVIASLPQGAVVHSPTGEIVAANSAALEILGLEESALFGRISIDPRWSAIRSDGIPYPGEDHPAMIALQTRQPVAATPMGISYQGEQVRWINVSAQPLLWDPSAGLYGSMALFTLLGVGNYEGREVGVMAGRLNSPSFLLFRKLSSRAHKALRGMDHALNVGDPNELAVARMAALSASESLEKWRKAYQFAGEWSLEPIGPDQVLTKLEKEFGSDCVFFVDPTIQNSEEYLIMAQIVYCIFQLLHCFIESAHAITIRVNEHLQYQRITVYTSYSYSDIERHVFRGNPNQVLDGTIFSMQEHQCLKELFLAIPKIDNALVSFIDENKKLTISCIMNA